MKFMELRDGVDFERKIFVKQHASELLRQELRRVKTGEGNCDWHGNRSLPTCRAGVSKVTRAHPRRIVATLRTRKSGL